MKKVVALVMALLLGLSLIACGNAEPAPSATETDAAATTPESSPEARAA